MAIRNSLATLIVTLSVGLAPIPALAVGIGGATAEFVGVNLTLTFSNDGLSDQDIVQIILYGTSAVNFPITWSSAGFPVDPAEANSSIAGEGTSVVTVTFTDVAGPSAGFNPGEDFVLFGVDADPGVPVLADLINVEVEFTFEDTSTTSGFFKPDDPGDPEAGLTLLMVPPAPLEVRNAWGAPGEASRGGGPIVARPVPPPVSVKDRPRRSLRQPDRQEAACAPPRDSRTCLLAIGSMLCATALAAGWESQPRDGPWWGRAPRAGMRESMGKGDRRVSNPPSLGDLRLTARCRRE
jgi:hypothetical protein